NHTGSVANTYDKLNRLIEWKLTKGSGSVLNSHDYIYHYDGNGNRTYIMADNANNVTNLSYNAANEWYQSTATGQPNPNTILSDGQGSVAGMADASGGQAAGYLDCPTGNAAEAAWGSNPSVNPFQLGSAFYDASFKSYWSGNYQYDANSGNAFQLTGAQPDAI